MLHSTVQASHRDADHGHEKGAMAITGFWIYLMTDCLIFATLFATFGVLSHATAGGPTAGSLFDLNYVGLETLLLLLSSFTFGLAISGLSNEKKTSVIFWLFVTFLLGASFIWMEIHEFVHLIAENAGPDRSAFLSAYFGLVGTHGIHVTLGLLWLAVIIHQVLHFGLDATIQRRLACLSLFWHFLDLVWVCVFSIVYLGGVL